MFEFEEEEDESISANDQERCKSVKDFFKRKKQRIDQQLNSSGPNLYENSDDNSTNICKCIVNLDSTSVKVVYVYSPEYLELCSQLPNDDGRSSMVHSLVHSYGLFSKMRILPPLVATLDDLKEFHSEEYLEFLQSFENHICSERDESNPTTKGFHCKKRNKEEEFEDSESSLLSTHSEIAKSFGLFDDCPLFPKVFSYVRMVAGGSLLLAQELIAGRAKIGIHWDGGRHHAKSNQASGFCYINDVVIAIFSLTNRFDRILYVDLDVHHCDGVQEAFYYSNRIVTLSFHRYGAGFFPGTGSIDEIGEARGIYHTINVPLLDGINDVHYFHLFEEIVVKIRERFDPSILVLQCGADCLANDPLGAFNLSSETLLKCISLMKSWSLPMMILGGGG